MSYLYPYGDTQQLNLAWFLAKFKELYEYISNLDPDDIALATVLSRFTNEYNSSTNYIPGDYVIHEGFIFKANQSTTGNFNPEAWDAALPVNDIQGLRILLGGISRDLTDLEENAVTDVQYTPGAASADGLLRQTKNRTAETVMTVDKEPTANSQNPVKSGAVQAGIAAVSQAVGSERTDRQNADSSLQNQIDDLENITGDGSLTGFTATDLTGAANELKGSLTLNDGRYIVDENSELLFIGDSYMTGEHSGGTNDNFVDIAMDAMGITNYHIKAHSGYAFVRTNQTFLSLLNDITGITDANKITHIVVLGGSNEQGDLETTIDAVATFKARAKELYPNARVIIGMDGWNLFNTYVYQGLAHIYRLSALYNGLSYIDGLYMAQHADIYKESDGHPSVAGHNQLATYLVSYLTGEFSIASPYVIAATVTLPQGTDFSSVSSNAIFTSICGQMTTMTIRTDVPAVWNYPSARDVPIGFQTYDLGSLSNSYVHGDQYGNCTFPVYVALGRTEWEHYLLGLLNITQGEMTLSFTVTETGWRYFRIGILGLNAVMPFYNS